ncbi:MAG: arginine--tRNA ligase [bacterium]|nr:arginine--tRNA ligase [bacterium]
MEIKSQLIELLQTTIQRLKETGKIPVDCSPFITVEQPRELAHGDFSSNLAFQLAKWLKQPPRTIAELIRDEILNQKLDQLEKVEVAGAGFINFYIKPNLFTEIITRIVQVGSHYGKSNRGNNKRVIIEFVSANPTGPLNVVNARAAAVGNTLANLLTAVGYSVHKESYINDAGNQINLFGASLRSRYLETLGIQTELPKEGYHGEYLKEIAEEIKTDPRLQQYRHPQEIPLSIFIEIGLEKILNQQYRDLKRFGVEFDCWFHESKLHQEKKLDTVLRILQERNYTYTADGALWFKSSIFGDEKDRVLIKSDGSPTYLLADIAYHLNKFDRGFELLIDLWGPDHHGHILRTKAAMQALGYPPDQLEIIIVQQVNLLRAGEKVKMSKRAGAIETLADLIAEVGVDAAKFFFLLRSTDSHLDFDLELAKQQTNENPVYYVQYVHARICSIFNQAKERNIPIPKLSETDLTLLTQGEEIELIKLLGNYPEMVEQAAVNYDPHRIPHYLMQLADRFHYYYNHHRVISDNRELTNARLMLMQAIQIVLLNAFTLIGISAPEKM